MGDSVEAVGRADEEWISLQEASDLLGVAASTVRRWADSGRVPVKRTLGGHRRFERAAVLNVARSLSDEPSAPPPPQPPSVESERDTDRTRQWQARFASHPTSARMRELGQQLLGVLLQFVKRRDEEVRFLAEGRGIGERYGAEARAAGVSMADTIEAFLRFRNAHTQYAVAPPQSAHAAALAEYMGTRERVDRFMDTLLMGVVAGHERGDAVG
jgi:excisionase family DNA binding protein